MKKVCVMCNGERIITRGKPLRVMTCSRCDGLGIDPLASPNEQFKNFCQEADDLTKEAIVTETNQIILNSIGFSIADNFYNYKISAIIGARISSIKLILPQLLSESLS